MICVSSCKNKDAQTAGDEIDAAAQTSKATVESIQTNISSDSTLALIFNMLKIQPVELPGMKQDAEVIINHRYKESERKSYILLDKDLWEYEFIFSGKKMSAPNQLAGWWIDFSEDLTYTYGHYEEVKGSGRYTFSLESGLLLLIDNSEYIKPLEFEVKLFDMTLVMDGNHIYKDNNYNAKLKRITERPKKMN